MELNQEIEKDFPEDYQDSRLISFNKINGEDTPLDAIVLFETGKIDKAKTFIDRHRNSNFRGVSVNGR